MNIDNIARASCGRAETYLSPAELDVREDNGYNILTTLRVKAHQQSAHGQLPSLRGLATKRRKPETERGDESATTIETTCERRRLEERSDAGYAGHSVVRRGYGGDRRESRIIVSELGRWVCRRRRDQLCLKTVISPRGTPQSSKRQFGLPQRVCVSIVERPGTRLDRDIQMPQPDLDILSAIARGDRQLLEVIEMAFYQWLQLTKDGELGKTLSE